MHHIAQGYYRGNIDLYLVAQDKYAATTTKTLKLLLTNAYDNTKSRLKTLMYLSMLNVKDP